jgi:YidC/Oxa1 family membrane protein insertase
MLKPMQDELQAKYKNNREKLNEEMMKLYQKEGYNPMSGCLPLLIQMPILFGLIEVIYRPLKHIIRLPAETIALGEEIVGRLGLMGNRPATGFGPQQLYIIQGVQEGISDFNVLGADALAKIKDISLNFLGMNLGTVPTLSMFGDILNGRFDGVILIPIVSGLTALALSIISMRHTPMPEGGGSNAGMKGMMYMMPLFSVMIAFQVPAGVGLYWVYSNITSMAQSIILNRFYNPKEMAEKARQEIEERRERERLERIEAKKKAKETGAQDDKAMSQKELNKKKIADARRRMAEKYGEEYNEDAED